MLITLTVTIQNDYRLIRKYLKQNDPKKKKKNRKPGSLKKNPGVLFYRDNYTQGVDKKTLEMGSHLP